MPRGHKITERDRNCVLDMLAQHDGDYHPRFTFAEIATACRLSERTVAVIVRQYAAWARCQEHQQTRLFDLSGRE